MQSFWMKVQLLPRSQSPTIDGIVEDEIDLIGR